jgi:hypothetical protein
MNACETPANWRKSSSSQNGDCVELAHVNGNVWVRDSKNPSANLLKFGKSDWKLFIVAIKSGAFDLD